MTRRTKDNSEALAAFITRKAEIDTMLARLQGLSDEHFNASPDDINWGQADDLADISKRLREISDSAFGEGEYANG